MTVQFVTAWGKVIDVVNSRTLAAEDFCFVHFNCGHRYYMTRSAVACECGESFTGPTPL